jgi:hypothetical protein
VNRFLIVFFSLILGCNLHAAEKKRFVLYAMLNAETGVQLADGARWVMDKGDTFPVVMFKEQQTKIVLQLAGTTFVTSAANVQIIEEKEVTPGQLATYRANVQHYLDAQAEKWKADQAKGDAGKIDPAKSDPAKADPAKADPGKK